MFCYLAFPGEEINITIHPVEVNTKWPQRILMALSYQSLLVKIMINMIFYVIKVLNCPIQQSRRSHPALKNT